MKKLCTYLNKRTFCLVCIIICSAVLMIAVFSQKQGYHIDEIYSYILSNSYDTDRIANSDEMYGQWISGTDFEEFVTVQEGEGFAFDKVYYNNSQDCHPPLFYWILHLVCSLFPNKFQKIFGLAINFIFAIIALIFVDKISREIIKSKWVSLLPAAMFGCSLSLLNAASFIRMYTLQLMIATMFILTCIRIFRGGTHGKSCLL